MNKSYEDAVAKFQKYLIDAMAQKLTENTCNSVTIPENPNKNIFQSDKYNIDKKRELIQFPSQCYREGYHIDAYHYNFFKKNTKDIAALYNLSQEEIDAIMAEIAKGMNNGYSPTAPHSPNSGGTLSLPPISSTDPGQQVLRSNDSGDIEWVLPSYGSEADEQLDFNLGNKEPQFKGPEPQQAKPHKCKCDWNEMLRYGCKCGGV